MPQDAHTPGLPSQQAANSVTPTAKASFDDIYNAPDPGPYYSTLRPLDYKIPQLARPMIWRLADEIRQTRESDNVTMLDLCCGYGVNGMLLKHDIGMNDVYEFYDSDEPHNPGRDRAALSAHQRDEDNLHIIGQDVAEHALSYARKAGFINDTLEADLESDDLTPAQAETISNTDLITITGGLSYIGKATLTRVLDAIDGVPWVLYFALRGTDVSPVNSCLRRADLVPERWHRPLPQRRYADDAERDRLLKARKWQADGLGPVSRSHQQAVLYMARPADEECSLALSSLVS